jgi:multisubunit Na+/H+ antiporter MnhB subunit
MKILASKPTYRSSLMPRLGAIAQIAFVIAIILSRFENPDLAFFEGMLLGFSIVGNLAYLVYLRKSNLKL